MPDGSVIEGAQGNFNIAGRMDSAFVGSRRT